MHEPVKLYSDQTQVQRSYMQSLILANRYQDLPSNKSSLKFFYENARSIRKPGKFDELQCVLKAISSTVHVIIITETWLRSEQDAKLHCLPNYTHIYNYRNDSRGGGVSIYIHNSIKFETSEEVYKDGNHYVWVYLPKYALHIGAIYKPGSTSVRAFLDIFSMQLESRKRSLVFGDFNLDLLVTDIDVKRYVHALEEAGFKILNKIDKQYTTRQTAATGTITILDHVSTDLTKNQFKFALLDSSSSDHKQIYLELSKYRSQTKQRIQYEAVDYENLHKGINDATYTNEENKYDYLENFINTHITDSKIYKTKIINLPKDDWINKEIIDMINRRNLLWQQIKADKRNEALKNKFIVERNKVGKRISADKSKYYYNEFMKCSNSPKKMWNLINTLAANKIKTTCAPPKIISDSQVITDGTKVCEIFNVFFSSVGTQLANDIHVKYHQNPGNTLMYRDGYIHDSTLTQFKPCTEVEITKIIDNLKTNSSTVVYQDCPKPLKIIRLGKYNADKPRPVKVIFQSPDTPKDLLKNKLKMHEPVKLYSDQTQVQRSYMQSLIVEIKRREKKRRN
ncbi:putative tick transposon [Operophtera brumata]|uniref:Putative tick transposon n=1 Tax=Operophtera brumata TaxID=104452 RepID=A0A0L7LHN9_OPEBR|nr:putative tick transposon [Operophtera brumata]